MRGLNGLLHPCRREEFLSERWPAVPCAFHGAKESVRELTGLPFLSSLEALLRAWPGAVQAHLPDVADEASAIDASPEDARKLFRTGMSLLFNDAQKLSPVLEEWLKAIGTDLGLPAMTHARCMVYATPDGKGTAAHFDQNVNFVLQLHGTKTWHLAGNDHVENPTQRHTLGQPLDAELASYAGSAMPDRMPEPTMECELKPGSVLFVPRGFWHRTEASGEALALNFTFNQPTWIDLFTAALRSRLSLSPRWRELADGVSATSPARRALAANRFNELLQELQYDLPNWRAEEILAATEGEPAA